MLQNVGIYDGANLALSAGTPLKPGFSTISLVLFDNKCGGDIRCLSDITIEEAMKRHASQKDTSTSAKDMANPWEEIIEAVKRAMSPDIPLVDMYDDSVVKAEASWGGATVVDTNNVTKTY